MASQKISTKSAIDSDALDNRLASLTKILRTDRLKFSI